VCWLCFATARPSVEASARRSSSALRSSLLCKWRDATNQITSPPNQASEAVRRTPMSRSAAMNGAPGRGGRARWSPSARGRPTPEDGGPRQPGQHESPGLGDSFARCTLAAQPPCRHAKHAWQSPPHGAQTRARSATLSDSGLYKSLFPKGAACIMPPSAAGRCMAVAGSGHILRWSRAPRVVGSLLPLLLLSGALSLAPT
jgi:hypothetical protein